MTKSILRSRHGLKEQSDKKTNKKVTFLRSPSYFEYYEPLQENHLLEERYYMDQFYSLLDIISKSTSSSMEEAEEEKESNCIHGNKIENIELLLSNSSNSNYDSCSLNSLKVCTSSSNSSSDDDKVDVIRDTNTYTDSSSISIMFFELSDMLLHSLQNSLNEIENITTNYFIKPIQHVHKQHQNALENPSLMEYVIKCTNENKNEILSKNNKNNEQQQQYENKKLSALALASEMPHYINYSEHKIIDHPSSRTKRCQRRRKNERVTKNCHQQVGSRREHEDYRRTRSDDYHSTDNYELVEMELDDPKQILLDISRLSRSSSSSASLPKTEPKHGIRKNKNTSILVKNEDHHDSNTTCNKSLKSSTHNVSVAAFKTICVKEDRKERISSIKYKKNNKKKRHIGFFLMKRRNKE